MMILYTYVNHDDDEPFYSVLLYQQGSLVDQKSFIQSMMIILLNMILGLIMMMMKIITMVLMTKTTTMSMTMTMTILTMLL